MTKLHEWRGYEEVPTEVIGTRRSQEAPYTPFRVGTILGYWIPFFGREDTRWMLDSSPTNKMGLYCDLSNIPQSIPIKLRKSVNKLFDSTMIFVILTALVWVIVLLKRGAFKPGLPASYRPSLVILSFMLLCGSCYPVQLAILSVFHPILLFDNDYIRYGIFPSAASFGITLLFCAAGCIQYYIAFRLAEQKRAGYLLGIRAAPYLFVATVLDFSLRHQELFDGDPGNYFVFGFVCLTIGAFYFWLSRFCEFIKGVTH